MSPLYLQDGKLLIQDGALATNQNCCCDPCTQCEDNSITISVGIDGIDDFILQGCNLTSNHIAWSPAHDYGCGPTAIVDGVEWPYPITDNTFDLKQINKKFGKATSVSVEKIAGRHIVYVTQQPTPANNWQAIIRIDDDVPLGPDCYQIKISWTC